MSDDTLNEFHKDLVAEVEEGLSTEEPFSAKIFTRLMLERLEEAGQFDGTFPLYQEGRIRNTSYRIDGYTYDEERSRLDLFTTIYSGDLSATRLPAAEVNRALERALPAPASTAWPHFWSRQTPTLVISPVLSRTRRRT